MTLMAGKGSLEDIRELWEPIKVYFDGLVCTYHGDREDEDAKYLEGTKGEGRIIYLPYSGRHDHSRNTYLWCGPIEQGDWCCQADTLERPSPTFLSLAIGPSRHMLTDRYERYPNIYYFHSKPFLFRYHESMRYQGTPHEMLVREDGGGRGFELRDTYPNEADVRENVRPLKRDRWEFVKHYGRYSLLPWGSNHYILPLSGKPNAEEIFRKRESARVAFIDLLRELNVKRDVDSIIEYMKGKMDPRFVAHVETDKVWNDVYRKYVLGREDFVDNHDWSNLVKVLDTKDQSG